MILENDRYTYRITWSEKDNEYLGWCAEFPSLSWLADSPESAFKGIRQVVAEVVLDRRANNETIPPPLATKRSSEQLMVGISSETYQG